MTKPRTAEEIAALPIGPTFGTEIRVFDGKKVMVPVARPVKAIWFEEDEAQAYFDQAGVIWTLGQYDDGRWFRRRA